MKIFRKHINGAIALTGQSPYNSSLYVDGKQITLPCTCSPESKIELYTNTTLYKYFINGKQVDKETYNTQKNELYKKHYDSNEETRISVEDKKQYEKEMQKFETESYKEDVLQEIEIVDLYYAKSDYPFIRPLPKSGDEKALFEFDGVSCAKHIFSELCGRYNQEWDNTEYSFYQTKPLQRKIGRKYLLLGNKNKDYEPRTQIKTYEECLDEYKKVREYIEQPILDTIATLNKTALNQHTLGLIVSKLQNITIKTHGNGKEAISERETNNTKLNELKKELSEISLGNM